MEKDSVLVMAQVLELVERELAQDWEQGMELVQGLETVEEDCTHKTNLHHKSPVPECPNHEKNSLPFIRGVGKPRILALFAS